MLAENVSLPCPCQSSKALIRRWERRSGRFRRGKIGLVWTRGEDEEGGDPSRSVPADRRKTLQSIVSQPQWDGVGVDVGGGGGVAPKTSNTGSPSKGHNTLSFLVRKFSEWWKDKNVWVGRFESYINIWLRPSGAQLGKVRIKRNKQTASHAT